MARIRGIVFDVGGTLIYPADPVGDTYARFARTHGHKLDGEAMTLAFHEAMKSSCPRPKGSIPTDGDDRPFWRQIVRKSLPSEAFTDVKAFELFFDDVYHFYAKPEAWGLYPEVLEVFDALRDHPVELAVLSNWDKRLHGVLDGLGLGEHLPVRFISSELGWEKPDAAIYRHVADVMRLPCGALLSVGDDAKNDVEGPKRAGWNAAQIERPKRDLWQALRTVIKR